MFLVGVWCIEYGPSLAYLNHDPFPDLNFLMKHRVADETISPTFSVVLQLNRIRYEH